MVPDGMTIKDVADAALSTLLIIVLIAGHRRWWVFGWVYAKEEARADKFERLALNGTRLAERAVDRLPGPPSTEGL